MISSAGSTPTQRRRRSGSSVANETISTAAQLLFVARNIERIGDHATNVAEMVHYAATGSYLSDSDG